MNDKRQLAAMGAEMAEQQQPMCMAKRIEELEAQVRVMAESLREAVSVLSSINHGGEHEIHIEGDGPAFWQRGEWVDWAKSEVRPRLQAALAGKIPAPVVPDGWQLVPVEPTREMMAAAMSAVTQPQDLLYSQSGWGMNEMAARTRYCAMLAAAPSPEAK